MESFVALSAFGVSPATQGLTYLAPPRLVSPHTTVNAFREVLCELYQGDSFGNEVQLFLSVPSSAATTIPLVAPTSLLLTTRTFLMHVACFYATVRLPTYLACMDDVWTVVEVTEGFGGWQLFNFYCFLQRK